MKTLFQDIARLQPEIHQLVDKRLAEFKQVHAKGEQEWFSELCYCLLTANARARTAMAIQNELGYEGFSSFSQKKLAEHILKNKHRFYNNKARYICESRQHRPIKKNVHTRKNLEDAREWLVSNVKGLGYKEASHFLRNTGHEQVAILDRHILRLLAQHKLIPQVPKSLNQSKYLEIEKVFKSLASKAEMSPARLDLYMWYLKTGEILK